MKKTKTNKSTLVTANNSKSSSGNKDNSIDESKNTEQIREKQTVTSTAETNASKEHTESTALESEANSIEDFIDK